MQKLKREEKKFVPLLEINEADDKIFLLVS